METEPVTGLDFKKDLLIEMAKARSGEILPCTARKTLDNCFTTDSDGILFLWYVEAESKTTRLISEKTDINEYLNKEN